MDGYPLKEKLKEARERAGTSWLLLPIADDELVLGWRDSEWTGSRRSSRRTSRSPRSPRTRSATRGRSTSWSPAEVGGTADELAFDRSPEEYRCSPFVELQLVADWARTIARHVLYEEADAKRIKALKASDDPEVAGLAAKIDREEAYHRMHAQMWHERLAGRAALRRGARRAAAAARGRARRAPGARASGELWEEMTMVRRSVAGAAW